MTKGQQAALQRALAYLYRLRDRLKDPQDLATLQAAINAIELALGK